MNFSFRAMAIAGISVGALAAVAGCNANAIDHVTGADPNAAAPARSPEALANPQASQSAQPSPAASPTSDPLAPAAAPSATYQGPHFRSPESAMSYLAAAYNSGDGGQLHAVTTPNSYAQLMQMRSEAVNLQLQSCTPDSAHGDYDCTFRHDYPASMHTTGQGSAAMLIAPADNPGWYLYGLIECG
ncbi:MAG: hypothetical protein J2P28_18215 [Actinobacteria bacterium]|nr:hypothetical protein [Actinomycetota bacterium]